MEGGDRLLQVNAFGHLDRRIGRDDGALGVPAAVVLAGPRHARDHGPADPAVIDAVAHRRDDPGDPLAEHERQWELEVLPPPACS
jgi:hypothetical protein